MQRDRGEVRQRLVGRLDELGEEADESVAVDRDLVVARPDVLAQPCARAPSSLTRAAVGEADRERVEVAVAELDGGGAHRARVESPAEQDADRDVGGEQPLVDGREKKRLELAARSRGPARAGSESKSTCHQRWTSTLAGLEVEAQAVARLELADAAAKRSPASGTKRSVR